MEEVKERKLPNARERGSYGHDTSKERGEEARQLRERHGLTRPILADLIGRSERSIFRWESQGITEENFQLMEEAINAAQHARVDGASGYGRLSVEALRQASTLDLALEVVNRSRQIEERNRAFDKLKQTLIQRGLRSLIPDEL